MSKASRFLSILPGVRRLASDHRKLQAELAESQNSYRVAKEQTERLRERVKDLKESVVNAPIDCVPTEQREPWYFLSHKLEAAYLQMPKAACSSIQAFILSVEKPETYQELQDGLKESVESLHHVPEYFDTGAAPKNYFRFTFVRHPFDRVLSFYKNQIAPNKEVSDDLRAQMTADAEASGFRVDMEFSEYVDQLVDDFKARQNTHVRPQSELLFNRGGLTVDYIGKIEEMSRHMPILGKTLGVPDLSFGTLNRTGSGGWSNHPGFTDKVVEKLTQRYWFDLNFLGYAADSAS